MASFPNSIKSFTTKSNGQTIDASHPNDIQDEVVAVETNLLSGSTGQVYIGGTPPAFASTLGIHRIESSQLSVSGASTFGTVQAGASTLASLSVSGGSTVTTLQAGNSTITGNLTVSGTITNAGIPVLLKSSTFSLTTTTVVDLSTVTVSGLTNLDTLEMFYVVEASTVAINNIRLRNKTDGVTVCDLNDQAGAGDLGAGRSGVGHLVVRQAPSANTKILSLNALRLDNNTEKNTGQDETYTTAWTGTIEYAFQGACSTTGGTLHGSWQLYKRPGQ